MLPQNLTFVESGIKVVEMITSTLQKRTSPLFRIALPLNAFAD